MLLPPRPLRKSYGNIRCPAIRSPTGRKRFNACRGAGSPEPKQTQHPEAGVIPALRYPIQGRLKPEPGTEIDGTTATGETQRSFGYDYTTPGNLRR